MQRRDFLKWTTTGVASSVFAATAISNMSDTFSFTATAMAGPLTPSGGEAPEKHITAYMVDSAGDYQAYIRRDNMPLTVYRAQVHQKYPYFYPVAGPKTGLSLTSESSQPWPHHRSLFFGCDKVNGGNYWQGQLTQGQIVSQKCKFGKVTETSAELIDRCLWAKPDEAPIMEDNRLFNLSLLANGDYIIDATITMKALTDVRVTKTNHGLFGVRVSHDISVPGGGILINSEGQVGEKETLGNPAKWMAFYGKRAGTDITEGIAVMIHPQYPDTTKFPTFKDCPWFTRDYGNCSPMPMNFMNNPLTLPHGESITLKYRVVAFAGTPQEAGLDKLCAEFAQTADK